MNRDDDQQLWDLLGQAAEPRVSSFFARNILRQIRQDPPAGSWLRLRILVPAFGGAVIVIAAAIFLRSSPVPEKRVPREPDRLVATQVPKRAPQPLTQIEKPAPQPEPEVKIDSQGNEPEAPAEIDAQDYEVVANLDDLLVLYETSLWDENSSL